MLIIDNSEYMRNGDYLPTRFEAQADAVNIVFQTKIDSNAESTVGIMTMAGKGYVSFCLLIVNYAMVLIFTNTVRRFVLLIRRIWVKLSKVFILLLTRSEDISTSRPLFLLHNLLSSIERTRTFVNASSYLLLHRWTERINNQW